MIVITFLDPRARPEHVGEIPTWLDARDPAKAREQLDAGYRHGGGFHPLDGFTLNADDSISYPGDPLYRPLAEIKLRDERILIYPHAFVAVIQPDRSVEVCRMD